LTLEDALGYVVDVIDRRSTAGIERATTDRAYRKYHLLGITRAGSTTSPNDAGRRTARRSQPVRSSGDPVVQHAPSPPVIPSIRTAHLDLACIDCVPEDINSDVVAALIVYGFAELGKGIVFDGVSIPDRHVASNVRRRYGAVTPRELTAAWHWLETIGIIVHGRVKELYAVDLSGPHASPVAATIAQRARAFFHQFRTRTR